MVLLPAMIVLLIVTVAAPAVAAACLVAGTAACHV